MYVSRLPKDSTRFLHHYYICRPKTVYHNAVCHIASWELTYLNNGCRRTVTFNSKKPLWYADKVISFKMSIPIKIIHHSPVSIFRDIDLSLFSSSFCSACKIDRISKETVPWHPLTYDTCDYLTSMDSYGYL